MPNRLTLLYSEIYYKKENYLVVKTAVFKYITPPIVKVKYISMLIYQYIFIFLYSHVFIFQTSRYILFMWLGYPSFHSFTSFISPTFCALILTQYKSFLSTCTILFIRSVTYSLKTLLFVLVNSVNNKSQY